MAAKVCECCGAVIPPADPIFPLDTVRGRIFAYVSKHPDSTRDEILKAVYGRLPDGGPESFNIIAVHRHQMNKTLAKHGMKLVASNPGPGSTCRLVML